MFNAYMFLYVAALFFVLTPGVLLTIPPKSSKFIVAGVHGLVFSTVIYFTYNLVLNATEGYENHAGMNSSMNSSMHSSMQHPRPTM